MILPVPNSVSSKLRRIPLNGPLFMALVIVVLALMPYALGGAALFQLQLVVLYVATGAGLNVAVGYSGELVFSQVAAIGVASYCAGILALKAGWGPVATLPGAVIVAIIAQLLVNLPGLRVKGLYLAVISFFAVLAFPQVVQLFSGLTGGALGLVGIPAIGATSTAQIIDPYEICVGVLLASLVLVWLFTRSGWGLRLKCLRDAPYALSSAGMSISATKLWAYGIAAVPAGLVGWALAYVNQSVSSSTFGLTLTLILFAGVLIVGPGSFAGPVIGVAILEAYSQFVGPFSQYNGLGLGLLLAIVILIAPGGLSRMVSERMGRRTGMVSEGRDVEGPQQTSSLPPVEGENDVRPLSGGTGLEVVGVHRSFGGNVAVDDATFTVAPGRVVVLMGENGSGKTTLVNIISGMIRPHAGDIKINGTQVIGHSAAAIAQSGCSRTFQTPQIVGELTLRENVEIGLLARESSGALAAIFRPFRSAKIARCRAQRAADVCLAAGISPTYIDRRADSLPVGIRRLVELARTIAADAQVICLDEPSAGLNEIELEHLSSVIRQLARQGRSLLVVEHSVRFVLDTADDILLMRRGSIVGDFQDIDVNALPPSLAEHLGHSGVLT